jgi:2-dehydro-3-deoxyphosphogluconate aldolase / (4S)-4-hydroxy-2-oxoglutarate aldolase
LGKIPLEHVREFSDDPGNSRAGIIMSKAAERIEAIDHICALAPVMPVISIQRIEQALPLARTLVDAGLSVLEITLRTDCALDAIALIAREMPEAIVGAGTVLTPDDLRRVADAGARFAISPGATDRLYQAADHLAMPYLPAVSSASDIMRGMDFGYQRFKLFPANVAGGVTALKAFAGPFATVKFCPTGGIDLASAPSFLSLSNVMIVGGSWMLPADAVQNNEWTRVRELAQTAAALRRP